MVPLDCHPGDRKDCPHGEACDTARRGDRQDSPAQMLGFAVGWWDAFHGRRSRSAPPAVAFGTELSCLPHGNRSARRVRAAGIHMPPVSGAPAPRACMMPANFGFGITLARPPVAGRSLRNPATLAG